MGMIFTRFCFAIAIGGIDGMESAGFLLEANYGGASFMEKNDEKCDQIKGMEHPQGQLSWAVAVSNGQ